MPLFPHQQHAVDKFISSLSPVSVTGDRRRERENEEEQLFQHHQNRPNGFLLLHELGLGKTRTAIEMATQYFLTTTSQKPKILDEPRIVIVCCPTSLLEQWASAIEENFGDKNDENEDQTEIEILNFVDVVQYAWKKVKQNDTANVLFGSRRSKGERKRKTITTQELSSSIHSHGYNSHQNFTDALSSIEDDFFLPLEDDDDANENENDFFFNFEQHQENSHDDNEKLQEETKSTKSSSSSSFTPDQLLLIKNLLRDQIKLTMAKHLFPKSSSSSSSSSTEAATKAIRFILCPFSRMNHLDEYLISSSVSSSSTTMTKQMKTILIIDEVQLLCYRGSSSSSSSSSSYSQLLSLSSKISHKILLSGYPLQNHLKELYWMMKLAFVSDHQLKTKTEKKENKDKKTKSISYSLRKKLILGSKGNNSEDLFEKIICRPIEAFLWRRMMKITTTTINENDDKSKEEEDEEIEFLALRALTLLSLMLHDCSDLKERSDIVVSTRVVGTEQQGAAILPKLETVRVMCDQTEQQTQVANKIRNLYSNNRNSSSAHSNYNNSQLGVGFAFDTCDGGFSERSWNQMMTKLSKSNTTAASPPERSSSSLSVPPILIANWLCQVAVDPNALPKHLIPKISCLIQTNNNNIHQQQPPTKLDTAISIVLNLLQNNEKTRRKNEKIVVFSHSLEVLKLFAKRFKESSSSTFSPTIVSGELSPAERHRILSKFEDDENENDKNITSENKNDDVSHLKNRLLLASMRSCGVGYNYFSSFTSAIILDSRWSPAHEHQAEGRICRLSSTSNNRQLPTDSNNKNNNNKTKVIYRLLTRNSVDETFERLQNEKREVFRTVWASVRSFSSNSVELRQKLSLIERGERKLSLFAADSEDSSSSSSNSSNNKSSSLLLNLSEVLFFDEKSAVKNSRSSALNNFEKMKLEERRRRIMKRLLESF